MSLTLSSVSQLRYPRATDTIRFHTPMPQKLPNGWVKTTLGDVCAFNPRMPLLEPLPDDTEVSFVPMAAVEEESGRLDASQTRTLGSVRKGYTPFIENDVLFAKITPCMENGKIALAKGLKNGLAYGSTEFFVFRPYEGLLPQFVLYFLLQSSLRKDAERQMSGASGQKRVPAKYLLGHHFFLPPTREQEQIVAKLDAAISRLERAETAARRAQERVKRHRAAVLHAAVTGELTRAWRDSEFKGKKPHTGTGEALLEHLLSIRHDRWAESAALRLRASGKKTRTISGRPYPKPDPPDAKNLPGLPVGWVWASLDQLLVVLRNGISQTPREENGLPILRISAVRALSVDLNDCRYLPASAAEKYRAYELKEGDLLFTRYNGSRELAGVCGRVPPINKKIVHPDKLIRGIPVQSDGQLSSFVAIAANTGPSRQYIEAHLYTTAGQWGISGRNLKLAPLPLPPAIEQTQIVLETDRRLAAAERLTTRLDRQLELARATRRSLLQEAFRGRLVPQDAKDEPASALLERILAARKAEAQKPKGKRMSRVESSVKRRPLLDVLREHKKPMTPELLFKRSGYQQDFEDNECHQEVVDIFYEELSRLVGPGGPVLENRPNSTTVLLEVKS